MNLESWLKQQHSLGDQLKVMEGLCGALNEGHRRGALHRGLEPGNIEVASDGSCNLAAAQSAGSADPRYRAPETLEGAAHSPQADIYSAGVIFYEMLSGKSPAADRPTSLADLRPDVARDLTDAVMGCLERGPDWRPKDLSYLLQVVRSLRDQGAAKSAKGPARSAEAPRPAAKGSSSASRKATPGSPSTMPLIMAVLVLLVGGGAGAWFWLNGSSPPRSHQASVRPPTPPLAVPATPAPTPDPVVSSVTPAPKPTPAAVKPAPVEPAPAGQAPAGPARPEIVRPDVVRPATTPTPPPAPARVASHPLPDATLRPVTADPTPTPTPVPAPVTPEDVAAPPPPLASEPTVLSALSPLQLRRGGTAMLDVRGSGLRADLRAAVLKIREQPNGISVVKQKFVSPGLIQVVVRLEDSAVPGVYGLALSDAAGSVSNTLSFTVAK